MLAWLRARYGGRSRGVVAGIAGREEDGRPRRKLRLDQREQLGEAGGVTGRDKRGQPRNPVDDGEPRIDARAVAGIDAAVDARGEREGRPLRKVGIERGDLRARPDRGSLRSGPQAVRRPAGGASAERICRTVASRMVRSMPGEAEKGGFISTVVGWIAASR